MVDFEAAVARVWGAGDPGGDKRVELLGAVGFARGRVAGEEDELARN